MTMTWFRTRWPRRKRWCNGWSYAPAAGRLAAAMATIWARRRRTLEGAERSNDRRCRMVPISSGADGNPSFREARLRQPADDPEAKLKAVRRAAQYSFPSGDPAQMFTEIERGYQA